MKILKTLQNVRHYRIRNNSVYYIDTDNNLHYFDKSFHLFKDPISCFEIFHNRIFVNDWNCEYFILDEDIRVVEQGSGRGYYSSSVDYLGCQYIGTDGVVSDALIDQNMNVHLLGKINLFNSINLSKRDKYFINKGDAIACIDIAEKAELWHFNLSIFGKWKLDTGDERNYEVIQFLGIWQNQLLVVCNSGTLLSLSVETGELLHRWDEYPKLADFYSSHFSVCMQLDEVQGEVIGFRSVVLWRLDLQTKEVKSYSMKEEFEKYDIGYFNDLSRFPITDTHYFVTAKTKFIESKNGHNEGIIAINKKTLKIDWHHFFDDSVWLGINVPEVTETHLYLRDNDNNLYIFEKGESLPIQFTKQTSV